MLSGVTPFCYKNMFREQKNAKNMFLKVLTEQTFCDILYPNKGFENIYTKTIRTEGYL